MQEMVANEVNDRMGRAVGELKDKYEKNGKGYDAASDAQVRERRVGGGVDYFERYHSSPALVSFHQWLKLLPL